MNPQKAFSLWITNSLCSIFIELWLQSKTIYSMQVWTLFGKVLERLRIHHVKICISVNVVLCTFTLGHLSKRYKTFAIFFVENFFFIVCFFSLLFSTIWCFSHAYIFASWAFWLILGVLTSVKCLEFLKRKMVREGRYFVIFQPKAVLNLCLNLSESWSMHAYKRCTCILCKYREF